MTHGYNVAVNVVANLAAAAVIYLLAVVFGYVRANEALVSGAMIAGCYPLFWIIFASLQYREKKRRRARERSGPPRRPRRGPLRRPGSVQTVRAKRGSAMR